jgi:hypothetical protein
LLPSYVDAATGKDSKKKGANGDNFIFVMSNEIDPVDISPPNRIKIISATQSITRQPTAARPYRTPYV